MPDDSGMGEISGFDWWFRDRDYVLRENLEALEASNAAAASRSARLSSQLSRLQGSLEHRLNALSAAFDAYVELGDVREQLAAYGEAAAIRREAVAAIGALGDGRPATPIDDRGTGYWVAAATNAVIARLSGSPDTAAEAGLRSQEPDAATFLVAALGALGRGTEVTDDVVALLHSADGQLDDHQLVLWHAVVRGDFGPYVIGTVLAGWHDQLDSRPATDWLDWASQQGAKVGRDAVDWIEDQAGALSADHDHSDPSAQADPVAEDQLPERGGLRGLVLELINSGFGDEKQLLATARDLRARIEHPNSSMAPADGEAAVAKTAVVDAVRSAFLALPASPARAGIFAAMAPALGAAVEAEAPRLLSTRPAVVPVRIAGMSVDVTPEGPDPTALAAATAAADRWADPAAAKGRLYAFGAAAVLCAVIALVLAVAGIAIWLAVLLLIAAVITGILGVRTLLAGRREDERRRQEAAERDRSITDAVQKASRIQTSQREAVRRSADQLDRIRALLSGSAAAAEQPQAGVTS